MNDNEIVFTTLHGEKYHKDKNCLYILGKKLKQMNLEKAKILEKQPCKGCTTESNSIFYKNWYNYKNNQIKIDFNNKNIDINYFSKNNKQENTIFNDSSQSNLSFYTKDNIIINKNISYNNMNNSNIDNSSKIEEKKESGDDEYDFNLKNNESKNKIFKFNKYKNFEYSSDSDKSDNNREVRNKNLKKNIISNIQSNNINNNIINKNGKEISEKIQNLIEKDKTHACNKYNKYKEINQNENENIKEKKNNSNDIIININNNNNINKLKNNSYNTNPLYLENIQILFNYFSINNGLKYNNKLNSDKNYIGYMEETNKKSQLLLFDESELNGAVNINEKNGKINNINDSEQTGCYKFQIEIIPFNEENNVWAKITLGFEVEYINIKDMNIIVDEDMINKENKDLKIGVLCENDEIKKNLIIFKKTGIIYALININLGKMFIVSKKRLEKGLQSNDIFFIKNFEPISIYFLKNIKPIFRFDKSILENFNIKLNNKDIK